MVRLALLLGCLVLLSGCAGMSTNSQSTPTVTTEMPTTATPASSTPAPTPPTVSAAPNSMELPGIAWAFDGPWPDSARRYVVDQPSTPPLDGTVSAYVWNNGSAARTLSVSLVYGTAGPIYQETVRLPANEALGFRLQEPGQYVLRAEYRNTSGQLRIPIEPSECNDKNYVLRVNQSGEIDDKYASTLLACMSPTS